MTARAGDDTMPPGYVDAQGDQVILSVQNFLVNTSSIKLDPQTARALGAALYLTAETVAKVVPA